MPTYEYQCNDCGRIFEVRQRISEAPLTRCDTCGGSLKRLLSAAPFILKGEGWYVTDYPSESRKKALASEKSGSDGASKSDGKKESTAPAAEKPSTSTASSSSTASTSSSTSTSAAGSTPAKTSSSD